MDTANIVATILAIAFLVKKNEDSRSVWELVYGKAYAWIFSKISSSWYH